MTQNMGLPFRSKSEADHSRDTANSDTRSTEREDESEIRMVNDGDVSPKIAQDADDLDWDLLTGNADYQWRKLPVRTSLKVESQLTHQLVRDGLLHPRFGSEGPEASVGQALRNRVSFKEEFDNIPDDIWPHVPTTIGDGAADPPVADTDYDRDVKDVSRSTAGLDQARSQIQDNQSGLRITQPSSSNGGKREKDITDDILMRYSNEFESVKETNWDTVLYIGPPAQQHGESDEEYSFIKQRFSKVHLMRSETLRNTGSAEFIKRLGPMSARVARKLKNLGLHRHLPQDGEAKYWIDLRPMQNDDEALVMVAELTCTPGVLSWYKAAKTRGIDRALISGKDKINTVPNLLLNLIEKHENNAALETGWNSQQEQKPEPENEPDYSPIRHHLAIERLLHAIVGNSPRLNSAPKMWNFFVIAKFFDCATLPRICDEIHSWIFSGYNSDFIEANPEVSYRVALGTQSRLLLRVAFAMLVGEKALYQALTSPIMGTPVTGTHNLGRPMCHLDDDEVNRIDHAAHSLQCRMVKNMNEIFNAPMTWMIGSSEMMKLFSLGGTDDVTESRLRSVWQLLHDYVRCTMTGALSHNLIVDHSTNNLFIPLNSTENVPVRVFNGSQVERYNALPLPQRLFTQIAWKYMEEYGLSRYVVTAIEVGKWQRDGLDALCPGLDITREAFAHAKLRSEISGLNIWLHSQRVIPRNGSLDMIMDRVGGGGSLSWPKVYESTATNLPDLCSGLSEPEHQALSTFLAEAQDLHRSQLDTPQFYHAQPSPPVSSGSPVPSAEKWTSMYIDFDLLLRELTRCLRARIDNGILHVGYISDSVGIEADIPNKSLDTLLCLGEEEFKYLPLWADGCDDGTGGVFAEVVPGTLEDGFLGGKRGLDTDEGLERLADIEMGEDSYTMINAEEVESTVARASKIATDGMGTSTVMSLDE